MVRLAFTEIDKDRNYLSKNFTSQNISLEIWSEILWPINLWKYFQNKHIWSVLYLLTVHASWWWSLFVLFHNLSWALFFVAGMYVVLFGSKWEEKTTSWWSCCGVSNIYSPHLLLPRTSLGWGFHVLHILRV